MDVYLAPGASGGLASIRPYLDGLDRRGFAAHPVTLPQGAAERAVGKYVQQSGSGPGVVVGGRSYGGRVASLAAADPSRDFAGLLLFAYPVHRPGFPDQLRTEHWPDIHCPVLVIQGSADPFGSPGELEREAAKLRRGQVVILAGAGHRLQGKLDEALDAAAAWLGRLPARDQG